MGNNLSNYCAVVAIDFGDACGGYAYSYRHDKKIHLNDNWGTEVSLSDPRSPSSILFKADGTFDSYGYGAENNFACAVEHGDYFLFRNINNHLHNLKEFSHLMKLKSVGGSREMSALCVFAEVLKYMKGHVIKCLEKGLGSVLDEEKTPIRWVITMPAMCGDKQKLFLREACVKGGLIKEMVSRNLMFVSNQECAGIYIKSEMNLKQDGTCYSLIDLGDEALDIAIYKNVGDAIEEVIPSNRIISGGKNVNIKYEEFLSELLGKDFLEHFILNHPAIWYRMMLDFECVKGSFSGNESIFLPLHVSLSNCYEKYTRNGKISDKLSAEKCIQLSSNHIILDPQLVKDMFVHMMDTIYELVTDTFNKCFETPSFIFVIGRVAECKYVQERLRDICTITKVKPHVVIPKDARLCVVKGATIFGHYPHTISTRMLNYTYAILNTRPYQPYKDNHGRKIRVNSKDVVIYLDPVISKGTIVEEGYVKYKEVCIDQSAIDFGIPIYSSKSKVVDDPNDFIVTKLCTIKFDGTIGAKNDTIVQFEFMFGNTEFVVKAMDKSTKEEVAYSFEF